MEYLTFGSFTKLVCETISLDFAGNGEGAEMVSQTGVIELLYSCIVEVPSFAGKFIEIEVKPSYATDIIKHKRSPRKNVVHLLRYLTQEQKEKVEQEVTDLVGESLLDHIIDLNTFFGRLGSMIYTMKDSALKKSLIKDLEAKLIADSTYTYEACRLVAHVLIATLTKIKNKLEQPDLPVIPQKRDDPFYNRIDFNYSEALNINIFEKNRIL